MSTSSTSQISYQTTIENLLRATGRENVDKLLALMRDHGFYRIRCYSHHRYQGGLAQHSLEVLLRMQRQNEGILPTDSIIVVALLHELCKIDGFPNIRHYGYRSVVLATRIAGFKLRPEEHQAILWHMHGPKDKGKLGGTSFDAVLDSTLWKELRKANHYSKTHPLTKEEFAYAMEGKHRRVVAFREDHCVGSESYKSAPRPKDECPRIYTEEDKRRKSIKRNNATIEDVFAALREWGIDPEDALNTVIPTYYEQQRSRSNTPHPEVDNLGFNPKYLDTVSPDKIEMHRTELINRCRYKRGAPKLVASYMYDETENVFDSYLSITEMHAWLKKEFGFPRDRDSLYKACQLFPNYTRRK